MRLRDQHKRRLAEDFFVEVQAAAGSTLLELSADVESRAIFSLGLQLELRQILRHASTTSPSTGTSQRATAHDCLRAQLQPHRSLGQSTT
jgi:hypothetical protein